MRAEKLKRYIFCVIAIMMVGCSVMKAVQPTAIIQAKAQEVTFEERNVLEDLQSSTVNGQPFDIKDYPFDESKDIQIITFVEYCYSYKVNLQDNYGLYIYVYNPKGRNIVAESSQNKVQMAIAYNEDKPTSYTKFNLKLCSKVDSGSYKNLFYKYKVIDREVNGKTFYDRVNSNERRYDISGIELLTYGETNATEYSVGGTYRFSGYAKGYGPDEMESTLSCTVTDLETLKLEVQHTNYRTNVSSLGKDHYNEVNTVYFAVPERIYEAYGKLQKIRAEWWEYTTKMAVVTSNEEFYNTMLNYIGVDVGEYDPTVPFYLYSGYDGNITGLATIHNYEWAYNREMKNTINDVYHCKNKSGILPLVFYAPNADSIGDIFSFLYSSPVAGDVQSSIVKDYIYNYTNDLGNGYIDCNGRSISVDLFESFVDDGRTMGYNDRTIDLEDTFDLNSYDSNHSWWDKLWDYGFSWPKTNGDYMDVQPIYEVKESDLTGEDNDISEKLIINENDVSELKEYYTKAKEENKRVVLFRFASTDYYTAKAMRTGVSNLDKTDTYVAQMTVFLDFDIIELTFNKDGEYRVIPVVSSPVDLVNGYTSPPLEFDWLKAILGIILLVFLVMLLLPLIPSIVAVILWVITLPVKLIRAVVQKLNKTKKRK